MPHDSVVAEPREEVQNGEARGARVAWRGAHRQFAALREAADNKDVSVEAPCVALVTSVFANAVDSGLDRSPVYLLSCLQFGEDALPLDNASEIGWLARCFPCFDFGCWDLIARNTEGPAPF